MGLFNAKKHPESNGQLEQLNTNATGRRFEPRGVFSFYNKFSSKLLLVDNYEQFPALNVNIVLCRDSF